MSIKYGSLNVDERYSGILEPNLYYNPVLVPMLLNNATDREGRQ